MTQFLRPHKKPGMCVIFSSGIGKEHTQMKDQDYFQQIAALTGLQYYPTQNPWGGKSGSVIGARDGYVTAIGFDPTRNARKITILVRFKKVSDPALLKASLPQSPALPEKKPGKLAATGEDFVRWEIAYSFTKPKAEDVANFSGALRDALKTLAPPFDGRCEVCISTSTPSLTMMGNLPGYICSNCQEKARQDLDRAAMNYEAIEPNYPNGLVLGLLAAFLGGIAWGVIAYGINRIFLYGAILIGYLISWAVIKGTRKVTLFGQILIPILTVASVLFGDAIFYTLAVMKHRQIPFSMQLFKAILANLWPIEKEGNGILTLVFALVGAGFALYNARKPKFKTSFQPLDAPGRPIA